MLVFFGDRVHLIRELKPDSHQYQFRNLANDLEIHIHRRPLPHVQASLNLGSSNHMPEAEILSFRSRVIWDSTMMSTPNLSTGPSLPQNCMLMVIFSRKA
jgi:hypothetical protein